MALPQVGVRVKSFQAIHWNTTTKMTFYLYYAVTFPIFSGGPYDGELSGDTAFDSDTTLGSSAVQTDLTNQLIAYLNTRYNPNPTFSSSNITWVS